MCSRHREPGAGEAYGADSYDIDIATADGPLQKFAVLMDVDKYDPDHGRAWITVTAIGPLQAMDRVRSMYPEAAVLRAEAAA